MSDDRARDGDLTYSVMEDGNNSEKSYEVLDKETANPISVYAMLDTTTGTIRPEGSPPAIQPGASPSCYVDTTEDSKKKDPSMTNKSRIIIPCLIALLVAFAVLIFALSVAFAFSFMDIFKLRSELAMLQ